MLGSRDLSQVADLIREVAAAELLPRFRNLSKSDIRHKRPGDVVTVADVASEQRLASGLAKILPGVPVVGEEAVEGDAGLLDLIGRRGEACWIVDPLDGTANFAAGKDQFAVIVCLVRDAVTVGAWILDVPKGRMAVALHGHGVTLEGAPVVGAATARALDGFVGYKVRKEFDKQLPAATRKSLGRISTLGCAGIEYLDILSGEAAFSLYRITKPWDHAAGALMMAEAGGGAIRFDGRPYGPAQPINSGIISAASQETLSQVRSIFEAVRLPLLSSLGS
jgi:fructose-1,6-bisphosphatase/inositol monophosphatase family enzyme